MLRLERNHLLAGAALVLGCTVLAAGDGFRDRLITKYGLNQLTPSNRDEVVGLIDYAARAGNAIERSGYEVFTLTETRGEGMKKAYIWTSLSGREYTTEHFIGAGAYTMLAGQSYLGNAGPMWLVLQKDQWEVKFTIK